MLDEIIEIMKKKPEILEDEPKEFKVMYEDIDLPIEDEVFNYDLLVFCFIKILIIFLNRNI